MNSSKRLITWSSRKALWDCSFFSKVQYYKAYLFDACQKDKELMHILPFFIHTHPQFFRTQPQGSPTIR